MKRVSIEHCRCIMKEELARVKSIAFHPYKKVIVAGLHSGKVQAWNYLYKTKVFELEEHEGPVRVVVFHHLIERFATGGDDCLIRLWNYKTRTVESVFKGHTDYIRSLEFHKTLPWLLSASDDQTIRIWNFQSKKQIACLTGHTHYVMCARFITDSLLVSVSLDQTIRVWDYSALTTKSQKTVMDMLGVPEVVLKHITDGHERGINWIAGKPDTSTFATGGDDSSIRVWDASKDSLFETDTLHGHHSHVSSLYYTGKEILISNSEDGTMKLWDTKKRKALKTITLDSRFWCVAMDPDEKILAAGHDTGFCIYSLEKEAPLYAVAEKKVYIQRGAEVVCTDGKIEKKVLDVKIGAFSIFAGKDYILMNYASNYILKYKDALIRDSGSAVVLENKVYALCNGEVLGKELDGREISREKIDADALFVCAEGVIGSKGSSVFLLDSAEKKTNLPAPVQSVHTLNSYFIFATEKHIVITDEDLVQRALIEEIVRINSILVQNGTIFYTTPMHIKFAFAGGNFFSLISTEEPLWLVSSKEDVFTVLNVDGVLSEIEIDMVEWRFKSALESGDARAVKECIEKDALLGQAPLAYLIRKEAYAEALKYVQDPEQCAELCIETKEFRKALEHAKKAGSAELLTKVGMSALFYDLDVSEEAFKSAQNTVALIFLYVSTNAIEKIDSILFTCTDPSYAAIMAILVQNNEKLSELISLQSSIEAPKFLRNNSCTEEDRSSMHTQEDSFSEFNSTDSESSNTPFMAQSIQKDKQIEDEDRNEDKDRESAKDRRPKYPQTLPKRVASVNIQSLEAYLKNAPDKFDVDAEMQVAMKCVTEGKISSAANTFFLSLHKVVKKIAIGEESQEAEKTLTLCSNYLQGLLAERTRRKTQKNKVAISCSVFFASLPLHREHKEKALLSAVSTCYKKDNRHTAMELAQELVSNHQCTDSRILSLAASRKAMEDAFFIDTSLSFCIDLGEYHDKAIQCRICRAWGSTKCKICPCCFISNLE